MSPISPSESADLSRPMKSPPSDARGQLIDGLRQQLGQWGAVTGTEKSVVFSCGVRGVDQLLPDSGLRHGMVVEWLGAFGGSGAATLGLLGAREACREGGVLVVVDRTQTFYPPAAAAWGIDLKRLIVVRPQTARDELWAAVQALRSPVVAALWANIERLDSRAFRRLQLAAEVGRTLGVLVRPVGARGEPTWADVRLEVQSKAKSQELRAQVQALDSRLSALDLFRRVQIHVVHCRGGRAGGSTMLEIDDVARTVSSLHDAFPLRVVTELADSAGRSRSARA
jgi:protein ImuA